MKDLVVIRKWPYIHLIEDNEFNKEIIEWCVDNFGKIGERWTTSPVFTINRTIMMKHKYFFKKAADSTLFGLTWL